MLLIEQPARDIDPRRMTTSYDMKLSYLCYGRLVAVDSDNLEPQMDLAERVTLLPPEGGDGGAGGGGRLRFDIKLRPARFWDNTPVEAEDLAYTFVQILDKSTGNPGLRRRFEDAGLEMPVQVLAADTVRVTLRHSHASFLTDLDFGVLKRGSAGVGQRPIGAGPFIPQGEIGEVSRFVRNPYYYGGAPPLARLTVRVVRDANSRLLSLVGGSADLTQNTVSPLLFDSVSRWQDRLQLQHGPSAIFYYLGLNQDDPHLRDVRVRRALAYAIDRERIVRTKLRGGGKMATGMLPTMHWAYTDDVEHYAYNPQKARALLDEAGLSGNPRLRLTYKTSTDALPVSIAHIVAAQLAEVGVEVEVRPFEFHVFLADVKKGNFQLFALTTGEVAEPNLYKRYFHSQYIPTAQNPDAGHNRVRYRNPEVDRLLDAGEREMDRGKRREIYVTVQKILARDLPILPMWHVDNVAVMRKGVRGYRIFPSAQFSSIARTSKEE